MKTPFIPGEMVIENQGRNPVQGLDATGLSLNEPIVTNIKMKAMAHDVLLKKVSCQTKPFTRNF